MTASETNNTLQCDETTLTYALLSYLSQDSDPYMVTLLTHYTNPAELLELLYTMLHHEGTLRAQLAQGELDTAFFECVHLAWKHEIDESHIKQFHNHCQHWVQQLSQLVSHNQSDIADMLTEHGKYWILSRSSELWPEQCTNMWLHNVAMPLVFWGVGNMRIFQACLQPVAIVGSRICNDYGYRTAHSIAQACAANGHTVIAGGAFGIDTAAHWGTLSARGDSSSPQSAQKGSTISIFAGGLNHMGPSRNSELFQRIVASDGALISELSPRIIPAPHRFLSRNRLIAALCNSLVVVQAKKRSGALNTAKWAREMFRTVYAVPGNIDMPHNAGCNDLLEEGYANIVTQTQHIEYLTHAAHPWYAPTLEQHALPPDNNGANTTNSKTDIITGNPDTTESEANTTANGTDATTSKSDTTAENHKKQPATHKNKSALTQVTQKNRKPAMSQQQAPNFDTSQLNNAIENVSEEIKKQTQQEKISKHPMLHALHILTHKRGSIAVEDLQAYMSKHYQYTIAMFNTQIGVLETQGLLQRIQHTVALA